MQCPNCSETLVMTERAGIEIDYCPKCRGVWLDKGELDKIIERSSSEDFNRPYESREQKYPKHEGEYKHQHRRKKGFLGDLFDFD
jgi:uncharacterized protein